LQRNTRDLTTHYINAKLYGNEDLPQSFINSIKEKGILVPLAVTEEGTIISGHRRWRAAKLLDMDIVPVVVVNYQNDLEEREAVIDFNRQREKLFSQRMAEAEELEAIERERAKERQEVGSNQYRVKETFPEATKGQTRDKVAEKVGLGSGKTYEKAKQVWEKAQQGNEDAQKLVEQIDGGRTTIHSAYKKINHRRPETPPTLPSGQYDVILADPPWRYEFSETSMRAIENQYPTMELEDIKRLNIPAADNSVLLLWATAPKLEEAIQVMNAWGYIYKTCAVWDKGKIGMGYWFRGQHELLLLGVKGSFPAPEQENRFSSVIRSPRDKHSSKPLVVHEMVEKMFPLRTYLELFAREQRGGWGVWGNEV
jgi:ParB/RepB/Spo0J family partition protein